MGRRGARPALARDRLLVGSFVAAAMADSWFSVVREWVLLDQQQGRIRWLMGGGSIPRCLLERVEVLLRAAPHRFHQLPLFPPLRSGPPQSGARLAPGPALARSFRCAALGADRHAHTLLCCHSGGGPLPVLPA